MRYQGRVSSWKDDKGFGFVTPNGGGAPVFLHIKAFTNRQRRPAENDLVTYELKADDKGRGQAVAVAFVGASAIRRDSSGRSSISSLAGLVFLVLVAAASLTGRLPKEVLVLYLVASVVAFIAYAVDKSAALNNRWRTKENTLHLLALVGGWPGALAAQWLLRHKSSKASFQTAFWMTVFLNCAALAWLFTRAGGATLRAIVGGG